MEENIVSDAKEPFVYEWACGHCHEVQKGTTRHTVPPADICERCNVGYCQNCGSRLKRNYYCCYWCGRIMPVIKSRWSRCDTFGAVYVHDAFMREGKGPKAHEFPYSVATVLVERDGKKIGERWLYQLVPNDTGGISSKEVRKLTPLEVKEIEAFTEKQRQTKGEPANAG